LRKKPSIDAPGLWLVLMRCHRALSHIAERSIRDAGLGLTDFAVLEVLLHKGPLTIGEIQTRVPLALGSMTATVDRLEKAELILRTPSPDDRRARVLKLSPKGRAVVERAFRHHAADLEAAMAILTQVERRQLRALLKKLGLFAAAIDEKTRTTERKPR
jgi:MarR family 2-MHQ and catechol resistance regulon transcriptional repressor